MVALHVCTNVDEGAVGGCGSSSSLEVIEMRHHPFNKVPRIRDVLEGKRRRSADPVVQEGDRTTASFADQSCATGVGGDKGGFGGGKGHIEIVAGKYTIHPQRSDDTEGNLEGSDAVLDVLAEAFDSVSRV